MSGATKCDVCGELVEPRRVVRLDVGLFKNDTEGQGWSGVDVCLACRERPLAEVLREGCADFEEEDAQLIPREEESDDAP